MVKSTKNKKKTVKKKRSIIKKYKKTISPSISVKSGSEKELHIKCANYLMKKYKNQPWHHPQNNVKLPTTLSAKERKKWGGYFGRENKLMAVRPGVPDLVIDVAKRDEYGKIYGSLQIELKTETGTLSKVQKDMHKLLNNGSNNVKIVRSLEEFIQIVDWYMKLRDANSKEIKKKDLIIID